VGEGGSTQLVWVRGRGSGMTTTAAWDQGASTRRCPKLDVLKSSSGDCQAMLA
jgi:hypothetical protein